MERKAFPCKGKGVFIWNYWMCLNGDPQTIANVLQDAGVGFVVLKVANGTYPWTTDKRNAKELAVKLHQRGIGVGGYTYVYLDNHVYEAMAGQIAAKHYELDFLLIDAEKEAKGKKASSFAAALRNRINIPIGLCSYRFPDLHRELDWKGFLPHIDFVMPQVYWRGGDPVAQVIRSELQYDKLYKGVQFVPAGEMYSEHGITTTPDQVTRFLDYCEKRYPGACMWALDKNETTEALLRAFISHPWKRASIPATGVSMTEMEKFFTSVLEKARQDPSYLDRLFAEAMATQRPLVDGDPLNIAIRAAVDAQARKQWTLS